MTEALTISCHLTQMSKHSKAGRGNYTLRQTTTTFHCHCQQNIAEPFDQSKILVYLITSQTEGWTYCVALLAGSSNSGLRDMPHAALMQFGGMREVS